MQNVTPPEQNPPSRWRLLVELAGRDLWFDRKVSLCIVASIIAVIAPLLLLFGLWFHIQRITRAAVLPPRSLAIGVTVVLAALALAVPVASPPPPPTR